MTEQIFHISHVTTYAFDRPVAGLDLTTRLHPPGLATQRPLHTDVMVTPQAETHEVIGESGARRYRFRAPIERLKVTGQTTLVHDAAGVGGALAAPSAPDPAAEPDAWHPLIAAWADQSLPGPNPGADAVRRFAQRMHRDFVFDRAATTRNTTLFDFFTGCRGVCEDYARLATACLRARGVPVRHVVGYLLPTQGRDSSFGRHAHAWISAWFADTGWIDLDPTTGLTVPERHVTLVRGYDRDDTLPVSGRFADGQSAGQQVSVDVSIVNA
ncbi:MAG: transglutaminase family protein [Thalassobaculaceae bacterium]|nr:transglutaminase family protein [Thalassobaculaceae bacterium]